MEGGERGGGEGGGIDGRRAAGDFGEEGAEVAKEGKDAEDGAEGGAEVGELFSHGDHCCEGFGVSKCPGGKGVEREGWDVPKKLE